MCCLKGKRRNKPAQLYRASMDRFQPKSGLPLAVDMGCHKPLSKKDFRALTAHGWPATKVERRRGNRRLRRCGMHAKANEFCVGRYLGYRKFTSQICQQLANRAMIGIIRWRLMLAIVMLIVG